MPIKSDRVGKHQSGPVEVELQLRVMGHDLEPQEVSRLLELEPTISHKRGEDRTGKGAESSSEYSEGLWAWGPGVAETAPLAEHIRALVDVLEPRAAVLQHLRQLDLRMDIFIGIFGSDNNFGFTMSPELLDRLGRLDIDLDFDLYCF